MLKSETRVIRYELSLRGKRVAILVENMYEDLEFWYPYYRLKEEGAEVTAIGSGSSELYKGKHGLEVKPDTTADKVSAKEFDGVVIPGGFAPDYMRRHPSMIRLVKEMDTEGKPVAAICHAGWVVISAGIVRGRSMTCFSTLKDDAINAGARYKDEPVVRDGNLITSRFPPDLPLFCKEVISALGEKKNPSGPRSR
jgi:protease I